MSLDKTVKAIDNLCMYAIIRVWRNQDAPDVEVPMSIIGRLRDLSAGDVVMNFRRRRGNWL